MRARALLVALALVGCDAAPSQPTWRRDVRPILEANCASCHGFEARRGAPSGFRLDVYENHGTDSGQLLYGAFELAPLIKLRTGAGSMPPLSPLGDVQIETLARWADNGAPRGDPDAGDQAAAARLVAPPGDLDAAGFVDLELEVRDPDFDLVSGSLVAVGPGGDEAAVTSELHAGRQTVRWDARALPEGSYVIDARLDDEQRPTEVELATYDVAYGGDAAPAISIESPLPDELLDAASPVELGATLADDGAAPLSVEVFAERGGEVIPVAGPVDVVPGPLTLTIDTSALEVGGNWRLRVVASDGTSERAATVGPLVIANSNRTTDLGYSSDMILLFGRNCTGCHSDTPTVPVHQFNLLSYPEARSHLGRVYRRVVQEETMPPRSIEVLYGERMSLEDRRLLAEWLLAAAPCPTSDPACPMP